jgi:hypothetical protein
VGGAGISEIWPRGARCPTTVRGDVNCPSRKSQDMHAEMHRRSWTGAGMRCACGVGARGGWIGGRGRWHLERYPAVWFQLFMAKSSTCLRLLARTHVLLDWKRRADQCTPNSVEAGSYEHLLAGSDPGRRNS